jgi:hypothetical protein
MGAVNKKNYNKDLIEWGLSVGTAEMNHHSKPFVIGLLRKCNREILPGLTDKDYKDIEHDGYIAMEMRKKKRSKVSSKPAEDRPKKQFFYHKDQDEAWMTP